MSNFYLCDLCDHYDGQSVVAGNYGYCNVGCGGYGSNLRQKKAMYDYGHERGHMNPYDNPLDICEDYEPKREDE